MRATGGSPPYDAAITSSSPVMRFRPGVLDTERNGIEALDVVSRAHQARRDEVREPSERAAAPEGRVLPDGAQDVALDHERQDQRRGRREATSRSGPADRR